MTEQIDLSSDVLNAIDEKRGDMSRAAYIEWILKKALGLTEERVAFQHHLRLREGAPEVVYYVDIDGNVL